jgi:hypothetical protein
MSSTSLFIAALKLQKKSFHFITFITKMKLKVKIPVNKKN